MKRDDIRKLLGGYATGTLTHDEERALFDAALEDQDLFDELAREQSLRDLLRDPAARAEVLAALDSKPLGWWAVWWRPAAAVAAMAGIAVVSIVVLRNGPVAKPVMVAIATEPPSQPRIPVREFKEIEGLPKAEPAPAVSVDKLKKSAVLLDSAVPLKDKAEAETDARRSFRRDLSASSEVAVKGEAAALPVAPPPPVAAVPSPAVSAAAPAPAQSAPAPAEKAVAENVGVMGGFLAGAGRGARAPRARDLFLGTQVITTMPISNFAQNQIQQNAQNQTPGTLEQLNAEQGKDQANAQETRQAAARKRAEAPPVVIPQSGVRYSVLRRGATGGLDQADFADVKSTDAVAIRFETNVPGVLYTWVRSSTGAWRPLASFTVERMKPYITPVLQPGENEVAVWFSHQMQMAMSAQTPPAMSGQSNTNLEERAGAENYVVNAVNAAPQAAQQVRFTIRLP